MNEILEFRGGVNWSGSRLFRNVPRNSSVMEIGAHQVIIHVGDRLQFMFDGPFKWTSTELEFNRQPQFRRGYVGLRRAGADEWVWFHTRDMVDVCRALTDNGATEVSAPRLKRKDIFSVRLPGALLIMGIGAFLFAITRLPGPTGRFANLILEGGLPQVGLAALLFGAGCAAVHLVGRR